MAVSLTCRDVTDQSQAVVESPVVQSPNEAIVYALTTTNIGSTPTSPTVTATNLTTGATVTATVLNGSASIASDVITLPTVQTLTAGNKYRIRIRFTISGSGAPFERYLDIVCRA